MYHKVAMPVGAAAAGGGIAGGSLWMIVAASTLVVAGLAVVSLLPKLRTRRSGRRGQLPAPSR